MKNKQFLQGKLTYLGLGISGLGAAGGLLGLTMPADEVRDIIGWLHANWGSVMELAGLVLAAYGRLRINWRKDRA